MKNKYQFAAPPSSLRGAVVRNKMVNRQKEIKEIYEFESEPDQDAPAPPDPKAKLKEPPKAFGSLVNRTMTAKLAACLLDELK